MATLKSSLRTLVLQGLTVGPLVGQKFFWSKADDGVTAPYIVGHIIKDKPTYHQQGEGPAKAMVQLDVYCETETQSDATAEAIRTDLSGYRGAMGDNTVRIFVMDMPSEWLPDSRQYKTIVEMEIGYAQ